jgi:UDP-N-acetylglucosamine 2-epimerase (non-hydrolysing)
VLKVLCVFGTRPEAIKMIPVVLELMNKKDVDLRVCVTAQHRQMLDQVLMLFGISPDYDLDLMAPGQDLTDITSSILIGMKRVFSDWCPSLVLVHGDTTTAASVALAAFYKKIPVAHVEAGLRTGDKYAPWPEEINRKLVAVIADVHFAPTTGASLNLLNEGISERSIFITGNTVVDTLLLATKRLTEDAAIRYDLDNNFQYIDDSKHLILVTGHRRESFGKGFDNVCNALLQISQRDNVQIVYPVHLNPNVLEPVNRILCNAKNIHLISPQDYLPFVYLMNRSYFIITDSGGVQEEAPSLGKPVLVTRDVTERPEALISGTIKLVGTNPDAIVEGVNQLLDNSEFYNRISKSHNPYGDGLAAKRIVNILLERFN